MTTLVEIVKVLFALAFYTVLFGGIGGSIIIQSWPDIHLGMDSNSWPHVRGTVKKIIYQGGHGGIRPVARPAIVCAYTVNRRQLEETCRISIISDDSNNEFVAKHPVGTELDVYYDPNDPKRTILVPGHAFWNDAAVGFFCGLFIASVPVITVFELIRNFIKERTTPKKTTANE
jgi:hypothetical protein